MATERSPDQSMLLAHAGKLERALWETGARINWVLVIQSIASFIVISIVAGIVSYATEVSVLGLKLSLSPPVLISGCSVAIGCLLMYQLGLVHHEQQLLVDVLDIYKGCGLVHSSLSRRIASPIENPGVVSTVVAVAAQRAPRRTWFQFIRAVVLGLFIGLPLCSQVLVLIVLASGRAWLGLIR